MNNSSYVRYDHVIALCASSIYSGEGGLKSVPGLLKQIIREEMWRQRVVEATGELVTYQTFSKFVAEQPPNGLGATVSILERLCHDDVEALDMLTKATMQPGSRSDLHNNIMEVKPQGTSRAYSLRRLAADAPALHTRVLAGELSPHAAMVEAGLRDRTISIPVDAEKAARAIRRHFTPDQIAALVDLLTEVAS